MLDFGLAKDMGSLPPTMGTAGYMSTELVDLAITLRMARELTDPQASAYFEAEAWRLATRVNGSEDSYAFGLILWELFSSKLCPHHCMSASELFQLTVDGGLLPTLPMGHLHASLQHLIRSCLGPAPERPSFQHILEVLMELRTTSGAQQAPAAPIRLNKVSGLRAAAAAQQQTAIAPAPQQPGMAPADQWQVMTPAPLQAVAVAAPQPPEQRPVVIRPLKASDLAAYLLAVQLPEDQRPLVLADPDGVPLSASAVAKLEAARLRPLPAQTQVPSTPPVPQPAVMPKVTLQPRQPPAPQSKQPAVGGFTAQMARVVAQLIASGSAVMPQVPLQPLASWMVRSGDDAFTTAQVADIESYLAFVSEEVGGVPLQMQANQRWVEWCRREVA